MTDQPDAVIMADGYGNRDFNTAFDLGQSGTIADGYKDLDTAAYVDGQTDILKTRMDSIEELHGKDRIGQKIIEIPVNDALANWRTTDNADVTAIEEAVYASLAFQEAIIKQRLFGCALILPVMRNAAGNIIAASRTLDNVVATETGITIDKLFVACSEVKFEGQIERDFYKPNFGMPKKIKIGNVNVHPSRVVYCGNLKTSYFNSIKGDLIEYHESRRRLQTAGKKNGALILETDVDKIAQMLQKIEKTQGTNMTVKEITNRRAKTLYANFNETDVGVLNKGETAHFYQAQNIGDLVKNVQLNKVILSGVSDIPYSRLFGRGVAGLGNASDVDFENYAQSLDSLRTHTVEASLRQYDAILSAVLGLETGFTYDWEDTKIEELRLTFSNSDQVTTDSNPNTNGAS